MTKKTRVAINGFGRIGRVTFKNLIRLDDIEVVAINDLTDSHTLAHLLKYDSIHGRFPFDVTADTNSISTKGIRVTVFAEKDPTLLPWGQLQVDVVLECTGRFTDSTSAS
ncbi:MAG: glyceraldehyde 3-phosphate dehydrogenase NAD-binding domain-containing protein, partial [Bacteroidota bacterium]